MIPIVDHLRVACCLACFVYSSWSDVKTREVSNKVWLFLAPVGIILTAIDVWFSYSRWQLLIMIGVSVVCTFILSVVLFYLGFFGGADAKALICLSLAMPYYPLSYNPLLGVDILFFPLSVFCNSTLFAALSAFYLLCGNVSRLMMAHKTLFEGFEGELIRRKVAVLFIGHKVKVDELVKKSYLYPLETVSISENGRVLRTLQVLVSGEKRDQTVKNLYEAAERGDIPNEVWATPGLPMLVFVTVGFITTIILGDILVWLILICLR